jgi:hypothetical protein
MTSLVPFTRRHLSGAEESGYSLCHDFLKKLWLAPKGTCHKACPLVLWFGENHRIEDG